ncbi:hypothetical protein BD779DRAFT_1562009 [Infundibulicybe gibba]|nr:hypothetical protein BD779DRAFT_1562009 [Infundibulicybe gibba]
MALAFLSITLSAPLTLFLTMPIHIGGLGFQPSTVGYIMGLYGASTGIFQASFFVRIVRHLGERRTVIRSVTSFMMAFLLLPVMSPIAKRPGVNLAV